MANFNIKYLDNYPVVSFEENIEYPEAVFEGYFHDVLKTEKMWGHILDSVKDNRSTQDIVYEKYTCDLLIGRNIDIYKLVSANHITVTPEYGTSFTAIKFEVDTEDTNNRDKFAKITFYKELEINYPMSSDYAEDVDSTESVNQIQYDVGDAGYPFNNVSVTNSGMPFNYAQFTIPANGLTNTIDIGDVFYLHTDNTDFNQELDDSGDLLDFAECTAKGSSIVTFQCSNDSVDPAFSYTLGNIIIDSVSDGRDLPSGVSITKGRSISVIIYTFIEPEFSHESDLIIGIEARDGIEENQKTIDKDIATFKIWLKESEKWKAEYLNYALFEDIFIELVNYDNILPAQTQKIITPVENDKLIELFEYDIKVIYNVKAVNIFR